MKEDDKWVENLRNKLEDYSEPLPDALWERLEEELSAPRVIPMWRTRRFVAAAAVLVVAVSSLTFWFINSPTADYMRSNEALVEELDFSSTPDDEVLSSSEKIFSSDNSKMDSSDPVVASSPAKVCLAKIETPENHNQEVIAESEIMSIKEEDKVEDKEQETGSTNYETDKKRAYRTLEADRRQVKRNQEMLAMGKGEKDRKWSVGLSAGNTPYSSSRSFGGMSRLNSRSLYATPINMGAVSESDEQTAYSQVLFNNRDRSSTTDVKHKMPVTVGLSIKWNITREWALETGMNYTMLSSELHSGSGSYIEEQQKLHYIGIPLKVHRSIWNNRWFSFYASAGGMVEKCVSGSMDAVYVNGNSNREVEHTSLKVNPLQWSVSAAAGAQVNFTKHLGLYAEPGIAYYFDDGSQIETIRKEHPFNFNLQFGLRFSFE